MQQIELLLARAKRYGPISDVAFRVLFSFIFIIGGLGHFFRTAEMLARIDASPWAGMVRRIGDPATLLWLSGIVLVIGGSCLALGLMTRLSALLLCITLVPITISIHVAPDHVGPLLKNVAILGGLLHFLVRGPGAYALQPDVERMTPRAVPHVWQ